MTTELENLMRAVGQIEGKLDSVAEGVARVEKQTAITLSTHNDRLSVLESFKARATGVVAVLLAVPGLGWAILRISDYFSKGT